MTKALPTSSNMSLLLASRQPALSFQIGRHPLSISTRNKAYQFWLCHQRKDSPKSEQSFMLMGMGQSSLGKPLTQWPIGLKLSWCTIRGKKCWKAKLVQQHSHLQTHIQSNELPNFGLRMVWEWFGITACFSRSACHVCFRSCYSVRVSELDLKQSSLCICLAGQTG